jgi:hypothetical protein
MDWIKQLWHFFSGGRCAISADSQVPSGLEPMHKFVHLTSLSYFRLWERFTKHALKGPWKRFAISS